MSQKKKNHISRKARRERDKQAEIGQAIDAIARKARARRGGDLSKKPGKDDK